MASHDRSPGNKFIIHLLLVLKKTSRLKLQGVKWIKQKYGDSLQVIRLGQKGFLEIIEKSIMSGATVLVENIEESVDPVLDALLGRNLIKKGK